MRQSFESDINSLEVIKVSKCDPPTDNNGQDEKGKDPTKDSDRLSNSRFAVGLEAQFSRVSSDKKRPNEYPWGIMDVVELPDILFQLGSGHWTFRQEYREQQRANEETGTHDHAENWSSSGQQNDEDDQSTAVHLN